MTLQDTDYRNIDGRRAGTIHRTEQHAAGTLCPIIVGRVPASPVSLPGCMGSACCGWAWAEPAEEEFKLNVISDMNGTYTVPQPYSWQNMLFKEQYKEFTFHSVKYMPNGTAQYLLFKKVYGNARLGYCQYLNGRVSEVQVDINP